MKYLLKNWVLIFLVLLVYVFIWQLLIHTIPELKSIQRSVRLSGIDDLLRKNGKVISLLKLLLVAPVLEEIVFRLFLNFKNRNIVISSVFFVISLFYWFGKEDILFLTYFLSAAFIFGLTAFFTFTFYPLFFLRNRVKIFTAISVFLFGFLHVGSVLNFNPCYLWFYTLAIALPRMYSGLVFAKVRLERGVIYAIALHFLTNLYSTLASITSFF